MGEIIFLVLLIILPLSSVVFFIVSLVLYLTGRRSKKNNPESVNAERLQRDKVLLIVSSIFLGIVLLIYCALVILLANAIAYM